MRQKIKLSQHNGWFYFDLFSVVHRETGSNNTHSYFNKTTFKGSVH